MPSKLWAVHQALTDLFSLTVAVPVFNGPVAQAQMPPAFVLVGTDGGETGTGEGASEGTSARQSWAALAGRSRQEEGEVICAAWAWSGSTDITPLRATATGLTDQMEAAVFADKKLGGVLGASGNCEVTALARWEAQRAAGAVVRVSLTVAYTARLT